MSNLHPGDQVSPQQAGVLLDQQAKAIAARQPRKMPESMRKRQPGGEEARFRWAFNECLRRNPNKAPSPTAINLLLDKPPPLNTLRGRQSVLRTQLLIEAGFVQNAKWGRWKRP